MIVSKRVYIKIAPNTVKYWRDLGYSFTTPNIRKGFAPTIEVSIDHLKKNSQVKVECWCEGCEKFFTNRFCRYKPYCNTCLSRINMLGNSYGKLTTGIKRPKYSGDKSPRWNPDTPAYKKYASKVYYLSEKVYQDNIFMINPDNHTRTLCGIENGYQLDHKISIKYGFYNNISPEELSDISNLQILPWKENRNKWHHSEIIKNKEI